MAYEGVGIPKIYEAQMPQQSSGGDIIIQHLVRQLMQLLIIKQQVK